MFASILEIPVSYLTDKLSALKKYLIQLASGAAGAGGMYLMYSLVSRSSYASMYFLGAMFVLVCFSVYILVPKEECPSYYANIFRYAVLAFGFMFIAWGGAFLLCYAFNSLIHEFDDIYDLTISLAIIFLQVMATIIYAWLIFERIKEPSGKVFKVIFMYIGLPVYLLLISILYVYLIKILFMWELPSGQINWFVSFATAIYLLIYFILQEYKDKKVMKVFYRFGGLILIPLVLVQFFSSFIRLNAYGFTGWRYTSLLYNIFAACCILFTFIKKGKFVKYAIPVLGLLGVIAAFTPLNLIDVAYNSQYKQMVNVLTKYNMFDGNQLTDYDSGIIDSEITQEDREKLKGAYDYIRYKTEHEKPEWFKSTNYVSFKEQFGIGNKEPACYVSKNYEYHGAVDISGYDSFYDGRISNYTNDRYNDNKYVDPVVYVDGKDVNLKDYILEFDTPSQKTVEVVVNSNYKIVVKRIHYNFDKEKDRFQDFDIEYYLLNKKQ